MENQFQREKESIIAEGRRTGAPFQEQRRSVKQAYERAVQNHNDGLRALIADFKQRANKIVEQAPPVAVAFRPILQAAAVPHVIDIEDNAPIQHGAKSAYTSVRIHYTTKTKDKPRFVWTVPPPHSSAVQRAAIKEVFDAQNDINKRIWGIEYKIPGQWQPVLQNEKDRANDRLAAGRLVE